MYDKVIHINEFSHHNIQILYKMKLTANRFVGFIDILGFKNLVDSKTHDAVFKKLSALVGSFEEIKSEAPNLRIWMFSDSILIITSDDSERSADDILFYTSVIITRALEVDLLAKGCIAYGKFTADFEKSIFFGKPLVDSYLLQEDMKMSSVILHHTMEQKLRTMNYKTVNLMEGDRCFDYQTPMKYGSVKHTHLNWLEYYHLYKTPILEDKLKIFKKYQVLIEKLYLDVSGQARQYLDNTINFMNELKKHYGA